MRLIDADALSYTKEFAPCGNGKYKTVNIVYETDIDAMPTIDPVKHGKWIKIVDCNTVQCSECFEDFDYIDGICYLCHGQELPDYCPNCGARMERGE